MPFSLLLILLIGAAMRVHALAADFRFAPDEALFATFARNASVYGDWLMRGDLDKTPLSLYTNALSMQFIGVTTNAAGVLDLAPHLGEFAARLPGVMAGIMLIPLVYKLAKTLYPHMRNTPQWAALFVALSPLSIAYSATALTDALMLPLIVLALWMAASRRPLASGIALALAFATKQQAIYALPLCLALDLYISRRDAKPLRVILPLMVGFALLLVWDTARASSSNVFALAAANNTPDGFISADQVLPRLLVWLEHGRTIIGAATVVFAALIPVMIAVQAIRRRSNSADVILLAALLVYAAAHWLIAFNTYDRYLLLILPLMAILAARAGAWLWTGLQPLIGNPETVVLMGALILSLISGAREGSEGRTPYNRDRLDYTGIDQLAVYLNDLPTATIVYDHWLGWELNYYLGAWADKRRAYYPDPAPLAFDAAADSDAAPRYFPAPADADFDSWEAALAQVGFTSERIYRAANFVIYRLSRFSP